MMLRFGRRRRKSSTDGQTDGRTAQIALYSAVVVVVGVVNDATPASNEDEFERDIMTSRLLLLLHGARWVHLPSVAPSGRASSDRCLY